ncbi:hypothetical protein EON73_01770 [bacterium]|nr:MAG: hypothetical protein EON73_01770 [bacterium]
MATLLSNIGDCLLSMYVVKPKSSQPNKADLYHSFGPFELFEESRFSDNLNKIISDSREFFKQTEPEWSERQRNHIIPFLLKDISETNMALGDVLHCYYWAGHLYERRGRSVSHSFQLRKMLYVLRLVLKDYSLTENLGQDIIKKNTLFLKIIQQHILDPILSIAGQTSEHSDRHMVLKFNQIFKDSNNNVSDAASAYINNNISNHPDTREGISLFLYIALKLKGDVNDSVYKDFITSYNSFATQYTRFFELDMWLKYQRKILNELPNNDTHKNAQIGVLKEYVFSLISKINTFDIYGTDYVINHSIKAHAHFLMAEIIHLYKDKAKSAIQNVAKLFGFVSPNELEDEIYHYRMAKSNYELSRQLHTGGKEYRNMMDGLIYLEDDINDNAYHFGAALDRYMMVNNVFDTFIKKCDEKLSEPRNDSSSSFFDGVFFND